MRKHRITLLALGLGCLGTFAPGCNRRLETGYKPVALGASATERRGYYAQPFTPEKKAAQYEWEQEQEMRRPKPGF